MKGLLSAASVCLLFGALSAVAACGPPSARPEVAVEARGTRYAPLPPRAPVKIYKRRQEPDESYREIGNVTSSCPERHWVGGQQEKGIPLCLSGLRQGARMLGGQGVVSVSIQRTSPPWSPDSRWLVMRGVVIRTIR